MEEFIWAHSLGGDSASWWGRQNGRRRSQQITLHQQSESSVLIGSELGYKTSKPASGESLCLAEPHFLKILQSPQSKDPHWGAGVQTPEPMHTAEKKAPGPSLSLSTWFFGLESLPVLGGQPCWEAVNPRDSHSPPWSWGYIGSQDAQLVKWVLAIWMSVLTMTGQTLSTSPQNIFRLLS